jgi:hypothetical protein
MFRIASKDSPILSYFKVDCPPEKLGHFFCGKVVEFGIAE